jgi:hypothetical protein
MKKATEMGSGVMIYIPSVIQIGSDIQKLIRGIHRHTDSMVIPLGYFHFSQNRISRLIK